ncbi:hypothetical protein [Brevibacterium casei]|uniref:Uncharacterized protein n=1 Tax=Brevibacterium casei CIP 102111 TaxID=1255625 RepID=A0A2H1J568_9MICO|nr:hypothetical protein [Brevibacterium casei]MBE4693250.1 hypothetical protein [Brevibacterium casei]MBY3576373.1 hypothetical protein [Brevibacterium casei]MCT1549596.1 hypothetical protein [Brevibacterium casei]MCT1561100.1 hypothetical protein [Brevibacterium casei]MCT2183656.1 hypothetical protein [Brevibacterium casei]
MKDQIDVSVRRSPKYAAFMAVGAILGVLVAGLLTLVVDPAQIPAETTVAKGAGLLVVFLGIIGLFLGGLVALLLDWRGRRRAREFRVEAQIDMVDDPKAVAARRLAEMRGEPVPDPGTEPGPEAGGESPDSPAEAAPGTPADDTGDRGDLGRSERPGSGA